MGKSKKGGLIIRQRSALDRLEKQYEAFKEAKKDKESWTTTRNGFIKNHAWRSYADECSRFIKEIENLKRNISKNTK